MQKEQPKKLNYQDAGISIERGNEFIERIKPLIATTHNAPRSGKGIHGGLGGFGAFFDIQAMNYKDPVLVSGTDGVGSKLQLAIAMQQHDTIGIDLVAMCVNDILVQGAEPLFFLDYFACNQLCINTANQIIAGMTEGCKQAGCALIGGETAEMPGIYTRGEYDLAGFCVGAVERDRIIDGHTAKAGDSLIGIASSGVHANGYSLVHKILEHSDYDLTNKFDGQTLGQILLEPTKIYVSAIKKLMQVCQIKALSHITGGGLIENLPRVIPSHIQAIIDCQSWDWPTIFQWIKKQGNIDNIEMYRTFNCGVGMIVCTDPQDKDTAIINLQLSGQTAWEIGRLESRQANKPQVYLSI